MSLTDEGPTAQAIVIISAVPLAARERVRVTPEIAIHPTAYAGCAAFLIAPPGASRYKVARGARALSGGTRGR